MIKQNLRFFYLILFIIILNKNAFGQSIKFSTHVHHYFDNEYLSYETKLDIIKELTKHSKNIKKGEPKNWNSIEKCENCIETYDFKIYTLLEANNQVSSERDSVLFGNKIFKNENIDEVIHSINSLEYWNYSNYMFKKESILNNFELISNNLGDFITTENIYNIVKHDKIDTLITNSFINYIDYDIYFKNDIENRENYLQLIKKIIKDVRENKLEIFDESGGQISPELFFKYFIIKKIIPNKNNKQIDNEHPVFKAAEAYMNYNNIVGIKFREEWLFLENEFDIIKKVYSIQLIIQYFDEFEGFDIEIIMPYKIKFND